MKTQNTQNSTHLLKSFGMLAIVVLIAIGSAFANTEDSVKMKKIASSEESVMIDELLAEMEEDQLMAELLSSKEATYEIYDANDVLVFKGNEKQWNSQKNKTLIALKRKAEFLMEDEGANIYKIF